MRKIATIFTTILLMYTVSDLTEAKRNNDRENNVSIEESNRGTIFTKSEQKHSEVSEKEGWKTGSDTTQDESSEKDKADGSSEQRKNDKPTEEQAFSDNNSESKSGDEEELSSKITNVEEKSSSKSYDVDRKSSFEESDSSSILKDALSNNDTTDRQSDSENQSHKTPSRKESNKKSSDSYEASDGEIKQSDDISSSKNEKANSPQTEDGDESDTAHSRKERSSESKEPSTCPSKAVYSSSLGLCLWFKHSHKDFEQAQKECEKEGGVLLEPRSEKVMSKIKEEFSAKRKGFTKKTYWIALKKVGHLYEWVDGSAPSWFYWSGDIVGNSASKNCAVADIDNDHKWLQEDCSEKNAFVCQSTAGTGIYGYTWISSAGLP